MTDVPTKEKDQLARLSKELQDASWLSNAQQRAQRRKSAWNLLIPLFGFPLWAGITVLLVWLASPLYGLLHPAAGYLFGNGSLNLGIGLVLISSLIASVCPALFLANILVRLIPAARRAMDTESQNFPGTGYTASQRALLKAGIWLLALYLPAATFGVILA